MKFESQAVFQAKTQATFLLNRPAGPGGPQGGRHAKGHLRPARGHRPNPARDLCQGGVLI